MKHWKDIKQAVPRKRGRRPLPYPNPVNRQLRISPAANAILNAWRDANPRMTASEIVTQCIVWAGKSFDFAITKKEEEE